MAIRQQTWRRLTWAAWQFTTDWPCLSFDFLKDGLGAGRSDVRRDALFGCTVGRRAAEHQRRAQYPATVYLAAGTQAAQAKLNKLHIIKVSNLQKVKKAEGSDDEDSDESDSDGDEEGGAAGAGSKPLFTCHSINHLGGINRVRADMDGGLVATWSELGCVHLWDVSKHVAALEGVRGC